MITKLVATGVFAFGMLAAAGPAMAGGPHTSGDNSVLGGNQIFAPISVPITVCGNAVAVIGIAGAGCQGHSVVK
jgi:hypothetical protein